MNSRMETINQDIKTLERQLTALKMEKVKLNRDVMKEKLKKAYDLLQEVAEFDCDMIETIGDNGYRYSIPRDEIILEDNGYKICFYTN